MNRTFAIVGPGRVGRALARELCKAGWQLVGVLGSNAEKSRRAALEFQHLSGTIPLTDWTEIAPRAVVVFLTTPDDVLGSVAADLARALDEVTGLKLEQVPRIALHASGALDSDVLSPLRRHGYALGSLHPLQSLSGGDSTALRNIAWGLEGEDAAVAMGEELVSVLQGRVLCLGKETKPLYHAAAAFASNYLVVLLAAASDLMERSGLPADESVVSLLPLVEGSLHNVRLQGVPAALTGPIERGDVSTVREHLAAFERYGVSAELQRLYRVLGLEALRLARQKKSVSEKAAAELERLLRKAGT